MAYYTLHPSSVQKNEKVEDMKRKWCEAQAQNVVVASNHQALLAAEKKAQDLGYLTYICMPGLEGEARKVN